MTAIELAATFATLAQAEDRAPFLRFVQAHHVEVAVALYEWAHRLHGSDLLTPFTVLDPPPVPIP